MPRYFIHFLASVVLLSGAIAGFNWWVDPYAIYRNRELSLQQQQPILVMNERVFKTVGLARTKADVVILGTSRTDIGIGREHQAFQGKRVFNLATFGQPIRESRRLMEVVLEHGKPQAIVVGLDFFAFNALFVPPTDFVEENYSPLRPYNLMLSISALTDSRNAVRRKTPVENDCCYADGFRTPQTLSRLAGTYRKNFSNNERMYLLEKYLPYPGCRFSFATGKAGSSLEDLRAMMQLAHRHHVDLRLFISPAHARQWETLAIAGLWEQWEEWKRELARINEAEAKQVGAAAFPLWDFSGYDIVSTEEVPAPEDKKSVMRWYTDSGHYTPDLGRQIIQRMFAPTAGGELDTWGSMMDTPNLEAHLKRIRLARDCYRKTHRQEIAEIENIAREVNRIKHCPGNQ
ncbi:MAG: hypothetical protein Q7S46_10350 [Gallionella sp.]|nr:hypothetical protein [Gallionella sp.]